MTVLTPTIPVSSLNGTSSSWVAEDGRRPLPKPKQRPSTPTCSTNVCQGIDRNAPDSKQLIHSVSRKSQIHIHDVENSENRVITEVRG